MRLDLNQVIQRHLKSAIACARATKGLLDERPQRQDAFASGRRITPQGDSRQRPDDLDDLRRGVFTMYLVLNLGHNIYNNG